MTPLRTLLADDHAPTLDELRDTLDGDPRFTVVAAVRHAAAAVNDAVRTRPDLCLLDVAMPGNGIAACWEITARLPQTVVVMFTVSAADNDLFAALRAGAGGYLLKDTDPAKSPTSSSGRRPARRPFHQPWSRGWSATSGTGIPAAAKSPKRSR